MLSLSACKDTSSPSIYDPGYQSGAAPTITSLSPSGGGLASATQITITGTNYSSILANNFVYFDGTLATIVSATATQLKVTAPNLVKDSIKVRVAVQGVVSFSNTMLYRIDAAVVSYGALGVLDQPYGVACDTAGNLYVSLTTGGSGTGVKKYTPAGVKSDYSAAVGTRWTGLKMGPGGFLYAARALAAIYRIPPGGGNAAIWLAFNGLGTIYDFDFDAQGNLWACANDVVISRVKPDQSIKTFPFTANARSIRVYNGSLYVAAAADNVEAIYRFSIVSADSLGPVEKFFDFAQYGVQGAGAYAITFSSDGFLYAGTNGPDGIILIHPDKTWEKYYPGLFQPIVGNFAWGKGSDLYSSNQNQGTASLRKINTQKTSAPYYGR